MEKETNKIREELQSLSPVLTELHAQPGGQKIPEGYFDELEPAIFRKIEENGYAPALPESGGAASARKGFRILRVLHPAVAAAAALVLIGAAWWFFRMQPGQSALPENYEQLAAHLSAEDAAAYIANNIHEFETATLENYAAVEPTSLTDPAPEDPEKSSQPLEELSDRQFELLLQDLSDEELKEIL
jgi:hypothetical protein